MRHIYWLLAYRWSFHVRGFHNNAPFTGLCYRSDLGRSELKFRGQIAHPGVDCGPVSHISCWHAVEGKVQFGRIDLATKDFDGLCS